MKKKFLILDGSSLLYRAFYALPLLENANGEYTNAIYGFSNMLIKLISDWQPEKLVIAFDKGKKTFRTELFSDYKGTRKPTPVELLSQIPILKEMAKAWNISFLEREGYEADDIIGTLGKKAVTEGYAVYVVTGDRDALQLIEEDLTVLFTKKGISELVAYDVEQFRAEYEGLDPIQLIDLKGLMGDSSDNIPGVPGIGPKTALKLIGAYGTVEEVLLHIEELSGKKLKENIRENQTQALLSKRLATIKVDVDLDFKHEEFSLAIKGEELQAFYSKYNMKSVQRSIKNILIEEKSEDKKEAGLVLPEAQEISSEKEGQELYKIAKKEGEVYILPQLTGKIKHLELEAMALLVGEKIYYINLQGKDEEVSLFPEASEDTKLYTSLEDIFQNEAITKYTYGYKNFFHLGRALQGKVFDLELIGYLINPARDSYALSSLMEEYYPELLINVHKEDKRANLIAEAYYLRQLGEKLISEMTAMALDELYWSLELPLVEVLASMESNGIYVNRDKLLAKAQEIGEKIQLLEREIFHLAGQEFNINSPKQLGEILFERLNLPVIKKTKTGYSTNAEVLEELQGRHEIIEKILDYRLWNKIKSTYLDGMVELIEVDDGRIHTTFNQTITATGRLSSSEPNLQNIPVRREEGKQIRELFEPGKGYDFLLSADYSQIELRVLGAMSQDKSFITAFNNNEDIHARTAAEVFDVPLAEVSSEMRSRAKAVNFGIVYGISDYGLSKDLHISRDEAKGYIKNYFVKCPGVKSFIDETVDEAKRLGYVKTLFGRRRYLPAIKSSNFNQRTLAERMAMNTPIQGTAADIIKIAMIRAYQGLRVAKLKSRILLQVHDELVLEVVEQELTEVKSILREAMEQAVTLSVPLLIDINIGKDWAKAK